MFNLLAIRSAAVPRLTRLINDPSTPAEQQYQLSDQLEHEKTKSARGELENTLRQNNLLPVVFQLLKEMGQSGGMGECRGSIRDQIRKLIR
jgi:ubiquitin carboxyl-terminal hydrolase L5